ncbi:MAG: DNA-processing protein DprA [Anaerolineales bacterium]|nr:DNA-processing protein DprA [Anaerolineales bacterium]
MQGAGIDDAKIYWVGFNLVKGIGAVRLRLLLDAFGDVKTAWQASPSALRNAGLSNKLVEALVQIRSNVDLAGVWQRLEKLGVNVITWEDKNYPRRLREINQPPPVLYARGGLLLEDEWAVAVVGTRRVTPYGRQIAEQVATTLAHSGVTVISGLAHGVDAIAHQAALNAGGRTVAVLGCGVDRIYPPNHRNLSERICAHGALLSDYALGTPPEAVNFPPRNRIISGLSMAVVVVEASERSGALITAQFAAEQGREVFAVPGNINAPQSAGANRLVQQGAHPLLEVRDLLDSLDLDLVTEQQTARKALPADQLEAKLLTLLSQQPMHVDELRNQADIPIEKISAALTLMELKGMVRQVGGMQYISVREAPGVYKV